MKCDCNEVTRCAILDTNLELKDLDLYVGPDDT